MHRARLSLWIAAVSAFASVVLAKPQIIQHEGYLSNVDHHCRPHCDHGGWQAAPSNLESWYLNYTHGAALSKWLHYFDIYDRHFSRFRGTDAVIVEIGVNTGGSLAMWRWYFGARARIVGIDLFNSSFMEGNPLYGSPDRMMNGDQASPEFWQTFKQLEPRVDILIDDGGHQTHQQLRTLKEMLPHIQPGGVLLTEDVMGSLGAETKGGKKQDNYLSHVINDYLNVDDGLFKFHFSRHLRQANLLPNNIKELFGISFYPMVIVFEKLSRPRNIMMPFARGDVSISGTRPRGTHMG